jgi:NitT/TauT family transport system substrate-binding protein
MEYTRVPSRFGQLIEFMYRTGYVKNKPASWKELFFEEAHGLPGS